MQIQIQIQIQKQKQKHIQMQLQIQIQIHIQIQIRIQIQIQIQMPIQIQMQIQTQMQMQMQIQISYRCRYHPDPPQIHPDPPRSTQIHPYPPRSPRSTPPHEVTKSCTDSIQKCHIYIRNLRPVKLEKLEGPPRSTPDPSRSTQIHPDRQEVPPPHEVTKTCTDSIQKCHIYIRNLRPVKLEKLEVHPDPPQIHPDPPRSTQTTVRVLYWDNYF